MYWDFTQLNLFKGFNFAGIASILLMFVHLQAHAEANLSGYVAEKNQYEKYVGTVPGATLKFVSEDGSQTLSTVADSYSIFEIYLPQGRWVATVTAEGYDTYTTFPGFVVIPDATQSYTYNPSLYADDIVWVNEPCDEELPPMEDGAHSVAPLVCIEADKHIAKVGEAVTFTVTGEDDNGLFMVWNWYTTANTHRCYGALVCSFQNTMTFNTTGNHHVCANARDIDYGVYYGEAHQASEGHGIHCVNIDVRDENYVNNLPSLSVTVKQQGEEVDVLLSNAGAIHIELLIDDPDVSDTHAIQWFLNGQLLSEYNDVMELVIDSSQLSPGNYNVEVQVTDSGEPSNTVSYSRDVAIVNDVPRVELGSLNLSLLFFAVAFLSLRCFRRKSTVKSN